MRKILLFLINNSAKIPIANLNKDPKLNSGQIVSNKYTSASNAITVLNASKFNFHGKDFSNIYIPFANLNNANLSRVNFSDANLQNI